MQTLAPIQSPEIPSARAPRSIGELISSTASVPADATISSVVRLFDSQPELDALAVIDRAAIRIVSRSRFFLQLGRRFGYALFENRPIGVLAEEGSTVEAASDPSEVITLAMQREASRIYDDIVVVENERFRGMVSMRSLLAHHKDLLVSSMAELEMLDEKNRRLEEIHQIQSEFVSNMTHELRTPLNTMLGVARAVMGDPELPGKHLRHMELLLKRGQDLLGIVNNMLDLSKLESGAMTPFVEDVELGTLLEDQLHSAEALVGGKPVRFQLSLQSLPRAFPTDPVLLGRILSNLLANAVKFTDAGTITLAATGESNAVKIAVRDTGVGIRDEDLERLFTKFTQLESTKTKRHAGTGLGLVIVKGLVDQLGGTIAVESRELQGTTFTVRLTSPRPLELRSV